jgi:hypothetical protein
VLGVELPLSKSSVVVVPSVVVVDCIVSERAAELEAEPASTVEVASIVVVAVSAAMTDALPKAMRTAAPARPAVRALFVMARRRKRIGVLSV